MHAQLISMGNYAIIYKYSNMILNLHFQAKFSVLLDRKLPM